MLVAAGLFVAAFLLGSIPFGLIISKVFYHTDLREHGSGNIGTTNAIRTMGKVGGYAVFVLDFGKGLLSGVLAWAFSSWFLPGGGFEPGALVTYDTMLAVAFLGCVWGHIFCPWLGFKGGKGIAVAVGCLCLLYTSHCHRRPQRGRQVHGREGRRPRAGLLLPRHGRDVPRRRCV